jgi:hypothetical protein
MARQPATGPAVVERTGDGFYFRLPSDGGGAVAELEVPIARGWAAMPAAYDAVGIELGALDPASYTLGNHALTVTRRLGKTPVTQYLDCGQGSIGSLNAATFRIRLSVLTSLSETATGGTRIETAVNATGTPTEGASRASTPCRSTGRLEQRLAEAVQARIRGASGG